MAASGSFNGSTAREASDAGTSRQSSEAPFSHQDNGDVPDIGQIHPFMSENEVQEMLGLIEPDEDEDDDDVDENDEDYEDAEDDEEEEGEEEEEEDDDDNDADYHDASEEQIQDAFTNAIMSEPQFAVPLEGGGIRTLGRHELRALLHQTRFGHIIAQLGHGYGTEFEIGPYGRPHGRRTRSRAAFPAVPSEKGTQLMESGAFGTNERELGRFARKKSLALRIMRRELGIESRGKQKLANRIASQGLIPSSEADMIVHYDTRCYSGQFSDDGNFFFSCSQDFCVRMYDTSNPYRWKYYRTVHYPFGEWTITDASLSPDNKYLAYSSIKSVVCLAPTDPEHDAEPFNLDFSSASARGSAHRYRSHFGIWSVRFSGDGRELVAGTSNHSVCVYDIESRQTILQISGHKDDVNAVCYGDKSSPHLLYSGSDDTTLKVWDRRSLRDQREAGVFLGHTEGLTYVDSKGDGRYVLSNGKDQTMKLWDLRKMVSAEKAEKVDNNEFASGYDYRFEDYDESDYRPHPYDCSLVTFRGHKVLKTLIRCHFSPPGSTDGRYVYSGSEDGSIYIYNLDATIAGKIDVQKTTRNTRPRVSGAAGYLQYDNDSRERWRTCVRDASWHPFAPVVAATSWNGHGMTKGTCTVHTWNDGLDDDEAEPQMGHRVNAQLQDDRKFYQTSDRVSRRLSMRQEMLRAIAVQQND